ncbi:NUDIX hydrolase [Streptomyces sp. NPDC020875]|uniref:NUDIX hydrolase n=1 Tax=Streptomyces sp. NPDC020875 TaxID=3154898 RepID=UPI0033E3EDFF
MTRQEADNRPGIAAAVVVHEGRLLMVRRRKSEGELSWQFPAGEIEPGESPGAATVREAKEETGLDVTAVRPLGERVHPATGRRMTYTACEVTGGTLRVGDPEDLAELAWVGRSELASYVPYGFFEPVQRYLDETLPD